MRTDGTEKPHGMSTFGMACAQNNFYGKIHEMGNFSVEVWIQRGNFSARVRGGKERNAPPRARARGAAGGAREKA
jgi:hypothetical protein